MPGPADDSRLEALVDTIVELASGNLAARMTPSPARDNIDAVITGINLLANELQDVHADLERRVQERTQQLEQARVELERLALQDPLTGLANRNLLNDRLDAAVRDRDSGSLPPTVMLVDLDQFKTINDSLGHGAGDEVLIEVARRLQSLTWPGSTVARLGGDEFAVLLPDSTPAQAEHFAELTLHALNAPCVIGGQTVNAAASIGLRLGDQHSTGELLLRDADTAMYAAKANGRANVQIYHPSMHNAVEERLTIASGLADAIRTAQLFLQYQPIVELPSRAIVGAEALVRWRHPHRGVMKPDDFLPVAESTGLIVELGRWVIQEAVTQLGRWQRQAFDLDDFRLSINLSPLELCRPDLDSYVLQTLRANDVQARQLVVELSEAALQTASPEGMHTLGVLREAGVRIAINDFGAGYSSVSSLRELPVDLIKLARSLLVDIDVEMRQRNFLEAVVQLVCSAGLTAVAEGVETNGQVKVLGVLRCQYAQGFFFGHPVGAEELGRSLPMSPTPSGAPRHPAHIAHSAAHIGHNSPHIGHNAPPTLTR